MSAQRPLQGDNARFTHWQCTCGWGYVHPFPLTHPPTHRCKLNIPRTTVLTPIKEI